MDKFLREWRQDAFHKRQNESAIYLGDKQLALKSTSCLSQLDEPTVDR
jgi:anaphase-promoting complex subunit 6